MIVHIHSDAEISNDIKPLVSELMLYACNLIGFDAEKITSVHIADKNQYPQAISCICPTESCSNNQYYVGVAKAISRLVDGNIEHHLIYSLGIIGGVVSYIKNTNPSKDYSEYLCRELLVHEIGHLIDNESRERLISTSALDTETFSIDKISCYYIDILLSEFFACFHSACVVSFELFVQQNFHDNSNFEDMFKEINNLKTEYINEKTSLRKVAYNSAQSFWMILIQYSKLIAAKLGNNSLSSIEIKLFNGYPDAMSDLMNDLENSLSLLIRPYPIVPDKTVDDIIEIWHKTALLFNFSFVQGINGDAVYFE